MNGFGVIAMDRMDGTVSRNAGLVIGPELAVILVVPTAFAVTIPAEVIDAMAGSEEDQFTLVKTNCSVPSL